MKESRRRRPAPPPARLSRPPARERDNLLASAAFYGGASPLCPTAPLSVYTLVAMAAAGPRGAATKGPGGHEAREVAPILRPQLVVEICYKLPPWKKVFPRTNRKRPARRRGVQVVW